MLKIEKQAKQISITEVKESNYKGQFVVEPLYRGYGNTLGNALRRVLLSSIPGAAIKGMRIEGVMSEFTVMDGVKEAVTEIILNVKEIVVKAESSGERRMTLSVKGPKVVKAADIVADIGLEIVNPEQVICTVTTDRTLDMEFLVDTGEGFVVSEEIDKKDWPVDYIAVDAIYTPIRKVSYEIQDTMFGRITDFDKLTLNVETDGSIEIRDALSYAVELLKLHLDPFLEIGNKMENLRDEIEEIIEEPIDIQVIDDKSHDMKIEELDLTVRSFNCLKKAGIEDVSQLASLSLNELLKIKNELNDLIDRDSEAYNTVMAAYKLPKETDEEKAARSAEIQKSLKYAIQTPYDIVVLSGKAISLLGEILANGNQNAITDIGVGTMLLMVGLEGGILNVKVNLSSIKDAEYVEKITKEIYDIKATA